MNAGIPTRIQVSVTFLDAEGGGRTGPTFDGPSYRPHLVVGDPSQRSAIYDDNANGAEHYLGVQFAGDGKVLVPSVAHDAVVRLCYLDAVDYSSLVEGATFTVREGASVVGFGRVVSWLPNKPMQADGPSGRR